MNRRLLRITLPLGVAIAIAGGAAGYRVVGAEPAGPASPAQLVRTLGVGRFDMLGALAISSGGHMFATAGVAAVYLVNRAGGQAETVWSAPDGALMTALALSPDGSTVAFSADGPRDSGYLLDVKARTVLPLPPAPNRDTMEDIVFSPDGRTLAAASDDTGIVYLFGVASRRISATVRAPASWYGGVAPVAFSPDGRTLAVGDGWPAEGRRRGQVALWDIARRKLRETMPVPGGAGVSALAFSPDGASLAAAAGRHVYLRDVTSGRSAGTLTGPEHSTISDVSFSPDGRMLAATLLSGHGAYLWNVDTGKLAAVMPDPGRTEVGSVAYSPDGKTVAVSDDHGNIFLWDVSRAS